MDARVHIFTATALGWGRMASTTLGRLYPPGKFPGGWVDPRASLDTKEWRKISNPPTPGIEPGPSSPQLSALPLEPPGPHFTYILYINTHTHTEAHFISLVFLRKSGNKTNKKDMGLIQHCEIQWTRVGQGSVIGFLKHGLAETRQFSRFHGFRSKVSIPNNFKGH